MSRFSNRLSKKTLSYTTDSSFLEKVREGNEKAWFKFYEKYSGLVSHIGQQRGLSLTECEDLMTDVMVVFWQKMDEFFYDRKRGKLRSYLSVIAHFLSLKIMRRKLRDERIAAQVQEIYPECINCAEMEEFQNYLITQALEDLKLSVDTETYEVFYMSFIQKRSVADISAITRKTANNIYVIRSRCLKKLKKQIAVYRSFEEECQGSSSRKLPAN